MNLFKHKLLATLLLAALGAPAAVLADASPMTTVANEPVAASQAERMERMRTMRARMHDIMQTTDPVKRRALMESQLNDMEAMMRMGPPDGMGMMMGSPGGMGMMMGPNARTDCAMAAGGIRHHDDASEQRLDALEKRVDMMQTMLHMMLDR